MSTRIIAVTLTDLYRLGQLLDGELKHSMGGQRPHLKSLRNRLRQAKVVDSADMLPDVVTMNSTIYLHDLDRDETDIYTLVYPNEANNAEGKLSILSPLGAATFGGKVGETVSVEVLNRESIKRIDKLSFQPERVGAFNL